LLKRWSLDQVIHFLIRCRSEGSADGELGNVNLIDNVEYTMTQYIEGPNDNYQNDFTADRYSRPPYYRRWYRPWNYYPSRQWYPRNPTVHVIEVRQNPESSRRGDWAAERVFIVLIVMALTSVVWIEIIRLVLMIVR
jgi:hypothetical protein